MTAVVTWDGKSQEIVRWDLVTDLGTGSDNLELNAEKLRRKQSKAKGMNILNGLNLADYNTWTMNLAISFLAA